MIRRIVAAFLILLGVSGAAAYLSYAPAHVTLTITDPPPQPYDASIRAIYITFTKVEIHIADPGNGSGWQMISSGGTVNLLTVLDSSQVLGDAKVPVGRYTEIRFFASQAIVNLGGTEVTYTIPGGNQTGIKVVIARGGFRIYGGQTLTLQLDLSFRNSEILNNPRKRLTPVMNATLV